MELPASITHPTIPTEDELEKFTLEELDKFEEEAEKTSMAVAHYARQSALRSQKIRAGRIRKRVAEKKSMELRYKKLKEVANKLWNERQENKKILEVPPFIPCLSPLLSLLRGLF
jgi:hypothetical protein